MAFTYRFHTWDEPIEDRVTGELRAGVHVIDNDEGHAKISSLAKYIDQINSGVPNPGFNISIEGSRIEGNELRETVILGDTSKFKGNTIAFYGFEGNDALTTQSKGNVKRLDMIGGDGIDDIYLSGKMSDWRVTYRGKFSGSDDIYIELTHPKHGEVLIYEDVEFINFGLSKVDFRSVLFEDLYSSKATSLSSKMGIPIKSSEWGLSNAALGGTNNSSANPFTYRFHTWDEPIEDILTGKMNVGVHAIESDDGPGRMTSIAKFVEQINQSDQQDSLPIYIEGSSIENSEYNDVAALGDTSSYKGEYVVFSGEGGNDALTTPTKGRIKRLDVYGGDGKDDIYLSGKMSEWRVNERAQFSNSEKSYILFSNPKHGEVIVNEDVEFINFGLTKAGFRSIGFEELFDMKATTFNAKMGVAVRPGEWGLPNA